jgi:hypothetical protein
MMAGGEKGESFFFFWLSFPSFPFSLFYEIKGEISSALIEGFGILYTTKGERGTGNRDGERSFAGYGRDGCRYIVDGL